MYWACPPTRRFGTTSRLASAFAASAPWSVRTTCRQRSIPAAVPAEVSTSPSSTNSSRGSTWTRGYRFARVGAYIQCVVAGRPSSSPAAASTNAPVQSPMMRAPSWCALRSAAMASTGGGCEIDRHAGTTIVPALDSASRPYGAVSVSPPVVASGPSSPAQTSSR